MSDPAIIREGGYQPTSDPGPVPPGLIRFSDDEEGPSTIDVIKGLAHEDRVEILGILNEREACPRELSRELDLGLSQTSYHVKVLKDYKLIERTKTVPYLGAVEHYFRARRQTRPPGATAPGRPGQGQDVR